MKLTYPIEWKFIIIINLFYCCCVYVCFSGEKVLCFHGPLIYEAKCLEAEMKDKQIRYYIHYAGWNKRYSFKMYWCHHKWEKCMIVLGRELYLKPNGSKNCFIHSPSKHCLFGSQRSYSCWNYFWKLPYVTSCSGTSKVIWTSTASLGVKPPAVSLPSIWKGNLLDMRLGEHDGWGGISVP